MGMTHEGDERLVGEGWNEIVRMGYYLLVSLLS